MRHGRLARPSLVLCLVIASTVLGLAGTDLILPAIPMLPEALGADTIRAQLVLAAYVAGTAIGLVVYGVLGDRYATRTLFLASLLSTAAASFACAAVERIEQLIALRAIQGMVTAGPAVFAPGIVKTMLDEARAVRAMGALGSIESLAPAIAPVIGTWLLTLSDWRLSFQTMAVVAGLLAAAMWSVGSFPQTARRTRGSYVRLMRDPVFLRYALSQAFVLGGLLTFVFGMPTVFVRAFGGELTDFIVMQVCSVASFVVAANLARLAVSRFGAETAIVTGTRLAAVGALGIFAYAVLGGREPNVITTLFVLVNAGFGLRGPPGFYHAVLASRGDDARGAALVILGVFGIVACGTAIAAPFVEQSLVPLAATALALHASANLCLNGLPRDVAP